LDDAAAAGNAGKQEEEEVGTAVIGDDEEETDCATQPQSGSRLQVTAIIKKRLRKLLR